MVVLGCLFFSLQSKSQVILSGIKYEGANGNPANLEFRDANGNMIPINSRLDLAGSPLFHDDWGYGILHFESGVTFVDSAIGYSLYNNKLFFKKGEHIYIVDYPTKNFAISFYGNPKTIYQFQSGYPPIAGNDKTTFYQVLFSGYNFSLLKWMYKKIIEPYNYGLGGQRQYSLNEEYLVFIPKENKMISLGLNTNIRAVKKRLPAFSSAIDTYTSTHRYNAKSDDDAINLFTFLDTQNPL